MSAIIDIAQYGSSAQEKRQYEQLRTVKTLDELDESLKELNFTMSRTYVYYRLMPKRCDSIEAKRHIKTVPVRLILAKNDHHKFHQDTRFCASTIKRLDEIGSFLGPHEAARLSQDDKVRVPLGITAATHQSPILMHMKYRVRLPDHDWVVAEKHKLIPSVYASLQIRENGFGDPSFVSASGPTYIAIRSAKHAKSTAYAHAWDFEKLSTLHTFDSTLKTSDGTMKPVIIVTVDGRPDENPRFAKSIEVAIHHFCSNDLDAYFVATNAPGRSAFNPVERRMAPLSRELSGLILPHNAYGSHLDSQGETIDMELEKRNFQKAGETLAEVWSNVNIDGFDVSAEYILPERSEIQKSDMIQMDESWKAKHVRTSQYCLQIVKCFDKACCNAFRSKYGTYFPHRFLPPPVPLCYNPSIDITEDRSASAGNTESNLKFASLFQSLALFESNKLAYDTFCPSTLNNLDKRICSHCDIYFASSTLLNSHCKHVHGKQYRTPKRKPRKVFSKRENELLVNFDSDEDWEAEWLQEDILDLDNHSFQNENETDAAVGIPVINMSHHFECAWENVREDE
ncbi:uncharacterized protein LOC129728479 [Wyeomyia smithii]|uniref:uncharacterized protein LOC129728479 n=1 Tax=Wyeomyia smithii TaxID=174621 RepID=UPI002467AF0B|nr:uncharacterized protein LOC129728479 [Wyeomyia smithii]